MNQISSTTRPTKAAGTTPENPAWKIRVVEGIEGFSRLRNSWDSLLHQSRHATIFSSWEWQYHWWKHYGNSYHLRILVVESDTEVVGIAPFYMRRLRPLGLFSVNILQLIGTGGDTSPDYLDLLCSAGHEVSIARRLSEYILDDWTEWDVVHWSDMPEASPLYEEFAKQARENFTLELGINSRISQIELPDSWERFIEGVTTKKRNKIRNRLRRMETEVGGFFFVWQDGDTLDQALHTLAKLHHKRWQGRANQYGFSSDAYIAFHRDIMHSFHARNWLRLFCLAVGDKIIAMDYCYQFNGTVMQFQRGFDSEYYGNSPGFVLMCHSFQEAIKEGNSLFDFLRGDYAHKKEFETGSTTTRYLNCYRGNGPAGSYHFLKQAREGLRSLLR